MILLPTLRQLRYLVALAEHGHFGRAAEACFVSQSTFSAGIKELEDILQAALVDRTKRRVVFTPLGLDIVTRARKLLEGAEELVQAVRAGSEPLSGPLRLGVIPTVGPFLLPKVLPSLRQVFPRLQLFLKEDLTARLIEDVATGKLDLALLALPCDCGTSERKVLFSDQFRLVCRPEHPLATTAKVTSEQLREAPLLLLEDGHCLRDQALAACHLGAQPKRSPVAATSLMTLVQMADNGLGVTLVPQMAIAAGILNGTELVLRDLADGPAERQIGLAWRSGTRRGPEFELLGKELARLAKVAVAAI